MENMQIVNNKIGFDTFEITRRMCMKRDTETHKVVESKTEFDLIFEKLGTKVRIRFPIKDIERADFKKLLRLALNCKDQEGFWNTQKIKIEKRVQKGYDTDDSNRGNEIDLDESYLVFMKRNSKFFTDLDNADLILQAIEEFEKPIEENLEEKPEQKRKLKIGKKE